MGGFFISNTMTALKKKGDTFKKNDILAENKNYFSESTEGVTSYNLGRLAKVAVTEGYYTYEDSSLVTEKFSHDCTSEITKKTTRILSPNANIDFIIKEGSPIKANEPLMIFEEGFNEIESNLFLQKLGDMDKENLSRYNKNVVRSHYTGIVEKIELIYTVPIETMNPSLQKVVKTYINGVNKKKKFINKYVKNINELDTRFPNTEMTETKNGKVMNQEVNGVLINFYIKYREPLTTGSKITFYSALKSIVTEVVPDDKAPYSDYRKDEPIDCFLGTKSVANRMVGSIWLALFGNKVLVELKRKCKEIFEN